MKPKSFKISAADYEDIHAEGYSECLRDMISNLRNLMDIVEEQDSDLAESLEKFLEKAESTLKDDLTSIN